MMNNMVFVPLRGKPSQSRLTPASSPERGSLVQGKWQLARSA